MRHGSRHESGRRHSADTLRSRSGTPEGGRGGGGRGGDRSVGEDGRSSWESMDEEGWESGVHRVCWEDEEEEEEGWEQDRRSWEFGAEEVES